MLVLLNKFYKTAETRQKKDFYVIKEVLKTKNRLIIKHNNNSLLESFFDAD